MNTAEKIKVMQAYLDGKPIECRSSFGQKSWARFSNDEPNWNWGTMEYRVAPPPKLKYWINVYKSSEGYPVLSPPVRTRAMADHWAGTNRVDCIEIEL